MPISKLGSIHAAWFILFIALTVECFSQVNYNQRDDKYRLLGLKRAKEAYEAAQNNYERYKDLHAKGLLSDAELDQNRSVFADAEVNYQQSLLAVLFESQYVSVAKAVKYKTKDGGKHVKLLVANTSGGGAEYQKLINIDDKLFRALQPDVINNVYISLLNDQGSIISQPYEAKIPELKFAHPKELDFTLLQDLDAVTISMIYANGTSRSMKIYLQKDASANRVAVQSEQFSQEVELGTSATYDLTLELFSSAGNTYSLEAVNLPGQIGRFFKDPASQARLSQFKFTESTDTRKAALEVSLPDRPSGDVPMDKAIQFFVLAVPREQAARFHSLQGKQWRQDEIEALGVGYARLEILPRGKGKLVVKAPQLYQSIKDGSSAAMILELVNEGTRRLDNIEVKVDQPLNWSKSIEPALVPALNIGEEKQVTLRFTPPANVAAGKYEMRVQTSGLSENRPVTGEDKSITIEIQPETSFFGTAFLVLAILSLVGGIVVFGIRLSRR